MKKLIFGCGYLGSRVARAWLDQGHEVIAVTRTAARASGLKSQGLQPLIGDPAGKLDLSGLEQVETILFAVGFDRQANQTIDEVYVGGLRNVLEHVPVLPNRIIYISSTGVYGQTNGEWVDEDSLCEPTRAGGKACLAAEHFLTAHPIGERSIILRLAGLYGPERLPKLQDVVAGRPLSAAESGLINLIHVDDAVSAVLAAERCEPPLRLLVSDGHPVTRGDFYRELAALAGAPPPQFMTERIEPGTRGSESNKRVRNARMLQTLGFRPRYASYREGLTAILGAD